MRKDLFVLEFNNQLKCGKLWLKLFQRCVLQGAIFAFIYAQEKLLPCYVCLIIPQILYFNAITTKGRLYSLNILVLDFPFKKSGHY